MTAPSIELTDAVLPARDARTISTWQRLYWSLRREVWEYRSIWIAPVVPMVMVSCAVLLVHGGDVRTFVAHLAPIDLNISAQYAVIVIALWHAPIYGWLLFLSSWAGRAAVVWAFVPFVALGAAEWTRFSTARIFSSWVPDLVLGWLDGPFAIMRNVGATALVEPAPGELLRTPRPWIGLVFATACIVGAVNIRRHRQPD